MKYNLIRVNLTNTGKITQDFAVNDDELKIALERWPDIQVIGKYDPIAAIEGQIEAHKSQRD